ncbi:MAG: NUDIX hydrolase [Methylomonas sp.]
MQNEYLAVVDGHDRVIDRRSRQEIHTEGLRHRAVHILVFNDQNQLFLQKRSMKKDLNKGLWDTSAAGHVDDGESYDSCAPRELWEELGIKAELRTLFKLEATPALGMEFIHVYHCQHNGPFVLASEEIDEGAWLTPTEVSERVERNDPTLTETFKIIWRHHQLFAAR